MTEHDFDMALGRAIKTRRTILGISQQALAVAGGITFQQVQKYERGVNRLSVSRLHTLALAMATTPQQLITEAMGAEQPASGDASDRESLELVKAFGRVANHTTRRRIADLVRAIGEPTDGM